MSVKSSVNLAGTTPSTARPPSTACAGSSAARLVAVGVGMGLQYGLSGGEERLGAHGLEPAQESSGCRVLAQYLVRGFPARSAAVGSALRLGEERRGTEALDGQPHAERQLPRGDRQRGQPGRRGALLVDAAVDGDVGGQQQWGADEADDGDDPRHEAGPVHHRAQAQRVDDGHEALSEQERPVVGRGEGVAGRDERGRIGAGTTGDVAAQRDDREQADDADEDEAGLQDPGGDEAESGRFALPPRQREQHHGGAHAGQRQGDLEEGPHMTPVVLPAPRTKSAWSRRGAYSLSVGIDVANVIRYSTPATSAVRRVGRADGRTVAGASGVLVIATLLGGEVYDVHLAGTVGVRCPPVNQARWPDVLRPPLPRGGDRWLSRRCPHPGTRRR